MNNDPDPTEKRDRRIFFIAIAAVIVILTSWYAVKKFTKPEPDPKLTPTLWIGHPMVSDNKAPNPFQGWIAEFQIGFREDGTVVWRRVGGATMLPRLDPPAIKTNAPEAVVQEP